MTNIVDQITSRVKALFAESEPEQMMVEAVVKDTGITISAESWEVGQIVATVTEEGDTIAIPEGSYELEDGTLLRVDAEGKILEIVMPEEEVEAEVETKEKEEMATEAEPTYVTQEELAAAMTPIMEALEKVSTKLSEQKPEVAVEIDEDKVIAENKLLKARLAEKRKNIAPVVEKKTTLSRKSQRGYKNGTLDRVSERLADFNFKLEKN